MAEFLENAEGGAAGDEAGDFGEHGFFRGGDVAFERGGGDLVDDEIAEEAEEVLAEFAEVLAGGGEFAGGFEDGTDIALGEGATESADGGESGEAEEGEDVGLGDAIAVEANGLVEGGLGIAEAAFGIAGDGVEGTRLRRDFFERADMGEVGADHRFGDAVEIEALAAGEDGGGELVDLGGGEDELHVCGGFLQRLQERVEGGGGEHVHLVDDVDFVAALGGGVADVVSEFADLLDAVVGGAVDFEDVEAGAGGDFGADVFVGVEVGGGAAFAFEGLGEDAGGGGFTGAAGADEEVGLGDASEAEGVGEGADDGFLADDFGEGLGSIFTGENLVGHGVG